MICETFSASTSAANWPQIRSHSAGVPLNLVMTSFASLALMFCSFFSSVFFSCFCFCSGLAFSRRIFSSCLFSLSCASCSSFSFRTAFLSTCLHSLIAGRMFPQTHSHVLQVLYPVPRLHARSFLPQTSIL